MRTWAHATHLGDQAAAWPSPSMEGIWGAIKGEVPAHTSSHRLRSAAPSGTETWKEFTGDMCPGNPVRISKSLLLNLVHLLVVLSVDTECSCGGGSQTLLSASSALSVLCHSSGVSLSQAALSTSRADCPSRAGESQEGRGRQHSGTLPGAQPACPGRAGGLLCKDPTLHAAALHTQDALPWLAVAQTGSSS